jgi:hypothetical protein
VSRPDEQACEGCPQASPGPTIAPEPSVVCEPGSATVLAGATKTIACSVRPNGYRGTIAPRCIVPTTSYTCDVSPAQIAVASDAPVTIVTWWKFDVLIPPKGYSLQVDLGTPIGTREFDVVVPPRVGSYDIACSPDKLELPSTGRGEIECIVSPVDGFDGFVRLYGEISVAGWTVEMDPVIVRVKPAAPATTPVEIRTHGLPLGSYPQIFAVQGEVFEHTQQSGFIWIDILELW